MRAAYYEAQGSAREVMRVGDIATPTAGPGEVRVKLATSGVNPSDVKSRQGGRPMANRLSDELLAAYKKEGKAMNTREQTHRMADSNKAFAHFAW